MCSCAAAMGLKKEIVLTVDPPPHKIPTPSGAVAPPVGSSSAFCWSPMEKLILHLSPVTRRKSLRNSNAAPTAANRRTMSEPNKNRMVLLNSRSSNAHAQQHQSNGGFVKKASLSSDLKAVAVAAVHEVLRAEIVATFRFVVQGFADE